MVFKKVVVHPLVLLSAVDHYKRMDQPRVVGTLLGRVENGVVHITNSYAVPFDEIESNPDVWFLDTSYNENMYKLFNKVNTMEVIVGWYHTGTHLHKNDLAITQSFQTYTKDPILVIVDVEHAKEGSPVKCYKLERESRSTTESTEFVFAHASFEIEAEEAEEVGVEQLIEDIRDVNIGDLGHKIARSTGALKELSKALGVIEEYLMHVEQGKRKYSSECMEHIQELMNKIPRNIPTEMPKYVEKMEASTYLCSVTRSVLLLNDISRGAQ
ncbi:26S proteasome regulatory subunit N8 [Nematocida sp. LUAm3]|nr:26S proteasome regulatory subunit N8 [Nematocida sp. LUAm3]KAI5173626.1 26S proteasome regulatory subunit N8 [Nematocida sp. LUAm2]KAI5176847.1 26S proteasome regulatory subunit N8 [Nematocida sp. LUAm1]